MNCEVSQAPLVTCDEVTFHYMRNFTTSDPEGQDQQFTDDQADLPFNVFGWVRTNTNGIAPTSTAYKVAVGETVETRMVFSEYIA